MTGRSENSNAQDEKGKAIGADEVRLEVMEMAGEVGVKWTGRLLNVCMQEGRIPKEWRFDLIVPMWKRKGGCKSQESITTQPSYETVGEGLDARIRRTVGDFGVKQ